MSLYRRTSHSSYQELTEERTIRLLRLDTDRSDFEGSLHTVSIDDEHFPPFFALSYSWGKGKKNVRMNIDGAYIYITHNLATALQSLKALDLQRKMNFSKTFLWIDQICINQADAGERGSQVSLMDEIYSRSLKTLVWLGDDHSHVAPEAFRLLEQIATIWTTEDMEQAPYEPEIKGIKAFLTSEAGLQKGLPEPDDKVWNSLKKFLSRSWFRRLWVVQEVVLSPRDPIVIWGQHLCTWRTLSRSARWLFRYGFGLALQLGPPLECINIIEDLREGYVREIDFDLGSLMILTRGHFLATDARDKVYGVLGLMRRTSKSLNQFGIHYNVDAASVYGRATLHTIISSKSLAILAGAKCPTNAVQDPFRRFGGAAKCQSTFSWVQNFSHNYIREFWMNGYSEVQDTDRKRWKTDWRPGLHASKEHEAEISQESLHSGNLKLRGMIVDIVEFRQETLTPLSFKISPKPENDRELLQRFKGDFQFWKSNRSEFGALRTMLIALYPHVVETLRPAPIRMWELAVEQSSYVEPIELITALLFVLSGGTMLSRGMPGCDDPRCFAAYLVHLHERWNYRRLHRCSQKFLKHVDVVSMFARGVDLQQFNLFRIESWCQTHRFFVTRNGYIGIGPAALQTGDRLCVLFGGGAPFILRNVKGSWALIGASVAHNLMDGQAIEAWQRGELKDDWFAFC